MGNAYEFRRQSVVTIGLARPGTQTLHNEASRLYLHLYRLFYSTFLTLYPTSEGVSVNRSPISSYIPLADSLRIACPSKDVEVLASFTFVCSHARRSNTSHDYIAFNKLYSDILKRMLES